MNFSVIGAGFFGLSVAIKLKEKYPKSEVVVFEKERDILMGSSGKNQFRCHQGFHYPRSEKTIEECIKSFQEFNKYFSKCFIQSENYYAISKNNSLTNFDKYLKVLKKNKLNYKIQDHELIKKDNVEGVILSDEKIINFDLVKKKFKQIIKSKNIKIYLNKEIILDDKFLKQYDNIFLCTYDNNNNILKNFGTPKKKYYYQLVEKIIVKAPKVFFKKSFVILDGPFMCIDPFYRKKLSILGSVKDSVIKSKHGIFHNFKDINSKYLHYLTNSKFLKIKRRFQDYLYGFDKVDYYKSFIVVRCTNKNANDERISKVNINKNIFKIFSGKWVNCMETAKNVVKNI